MSISAPCCYVHSSKQLGHGKTEVRRIRALLDMPMLEVLKQFTTLKIGLERQSSWSQWDNSTVLHLVGGVYSISKQRRQILFEISFEIAPAMLTVHRLQI